MAIWIQKIGPSRGQYRVTLPKDLVKRAGLEKARVVEVWCTEESIIHIREYHAKKERPKLYRDGRTRVDRSS
jgi:antitoxin component of MazEF toxin-antitoxin module